MSPLRTVLVMALLAGLATGSRAAEISAVAGFDGAMWQNAVTPVRITVESIEPFLGEVRVVHQRQNLRRIPIELLQGGRITTTIALRLPPGFDIILYNARDSEIRRIAGYTTGRQRNFTDAFDIADLSRNPVHIRDAHTATLPNGSKVEIFHLPPAEFPEIEEILDPIDAILIGDISYDEFSPPARAALRSWIAGGGILIVRGGANAEALSRSFLAPVLPLKNLTAAYRDGVLIMSGDKVSEAQPSRGPRHAPWLRVDGRRGEGDIRVLLYDPADQPFRDTAGTIAQFFSPGDEKRLQRNIFEQKSWMTGAILSRLSEGTGTYEIGESGVATALAFLLVYAVVVGPVNFFVLTRIRRRELAWITIPTIVLVFVGAALGVGNAMLDRATAYREFSLVVNDQTAGSEEIQTWCGIYSSGSKSYRLELPGRTATAEEVTRNTHGLASGGASVIGFVGAGPAASDEFEVKNWSWRYAKATSRKSPEAEVIWDETNEEIRVHGDLDLDGALITTGNLREWRKLQPAGNGIHHLGLEQAELRIPDGLAINPGPGALVVIPERDAPPLIASGIADRKATRIVLIRPRMNES